MTPILFSDRGCPFAHRVLALAEHLGAPLDRREAIVGEKPRGLSRYSTSGRIPLLVDGELVVSESRVILEHLAERHGFAEALPRSLVDRTRHRHAMAVTDAVLAPRLFLAAEAPMDPRRLDDALSWIEDATARTEPAPSLLAFHLAPIGLRFRWWLPSGAVTRAILARPALARWLDDAAELDAVARTSPDLATHCADVARARSAGLVPA